jgi:hypothetical protein
MDDSVAQKSGLKSGTHQRHKNAKDDGREKGEQEPLKPTNAKMDIAINPSGDGTNKSKSKAASGPDRC